MKEGKRTPHGISLFEQRIPNTILKSSQCKLTNRFFQLVSISSTLIICNQFLFILLGSAVYLLKSYASVVICPKNFESPVLYTIHFIVAFRISWTFLPLYTIIDLQFLTGGPQFTHVRKEDIRLTNLGQLIRMIEYIKKEHGFHYQVKYMNTWT